MMDVVVYRTLRRSDREFVLSTMLRSLHYGCDYFAAIDNDAFFYNYATIVQHLLDKAANSMVACLSEDDDVILGYVLADPGVVHFVYVKDAWRKQGIGGSLVAHAAQSAGQLITTCTHITKPGNAIRKKKRWVLNPWKL